MRRAAGLAYAERMTFTVVRAVRGFESTTAADAVDKMRKSVASPVPVRAAAMDLPYAETVIRLDFISADFPKTIPDLLS